MATAKTKKEISTPKNVQEAFDFPGDQLYQVTVFGQVWQVNGISHSKGNVYQADLVKNSGDTVEKRSVALSAEHPVEALKSPIVEEDLLA